MLLLGLLTIGQLRAQVQSEISFDRIAYLQYEPILANVTIVNQSARPLVFGELDDDWLQFRILDEFESELPQARTYQKSPSIKINPASEATKTLNITPLYSIRKPGRYRIAAVTTVNGRTFRSRPKVIEIREGQTLWQQQAGFLDKNQNEEFRTFSLIQFPRFDEPFLYMQIAGQDGIIYTNTRLAKILNPDSVRAEFDNERRIHILFQTEPSAYGYYVADKDGKKVDAAIYTSHNSNPILKVDARRVVGVVGGDRQRDNDPDMPAMPRFIPPPLPAAKP